MSFNNTFILSFGTSLYDISYFIYLFLSICNWNLINCKNIMIRPKMLLHFHKNFIFNYGWFQFDSLLFYFVL